MAANAFLDLLSTSQENLYLVGRENDEMCLSEVFKTIPLSVNCINHAPYICYVDGNNKAHLVQGCCNSWTCPRCGHQRAKTEYGRMVAGAKILDEQGKQLCMHTWTCRGREMALEEAERDYGKWTNVMLQACRDRSKVQGDEWTYVQVTERQKRAHPHSHIITSFLPDDAVLKTVKKWGKSGQLEDREVYTSAWYERRLKSAGFGEQYDITPIRSITGCAVYCAKYLFKDCMFTDWPPKWKRIRYAQSWPKNPDHKAPDIAFAILKYDDWKKVDALGRKVYADSLDTMVCARRYGQNSVTFKVKEA